MLELIALSHSWLNLLDSRDISISAHTSSVIHVPFQVSGTDFHILYRWFSMDLNVKIHEDPRRLGSDENTRNNRHSDDNAGGNTSWHQCDALKLSGNDQIVWEPASQCTMECERAIQAKTILTKVGFVLGIFWPGVAPSIYAFSSLCTIPEFRHTNETRRSS